MGFQVRDARITDIDRIAALLNLNPPDSSDPEQAGAKVPNLLRQLVYLPNATVLVVTEGRKVIGSAVLALRPSVSRGGLVGTIDVLVVDPDHRGEAVTRALLDETLRSARNKGCVVVEAVQPEDDVERQRLSDYGFRGSEPNVVRGLARVGVA